VGSGGVCQQRELGSLFRIPLKRLSMVMEEPGDSPQIINEWGGAWVVSG
jgi:hypothetical protein